MTGDLPNVCADRRWVAFMHSYPNFVPLSGPVVARVAGALAPLAFDRLYGWAPERVIPAGARDAVERSAVRHRLALQP